MTTNRPDSPCKGVCTTTYDEYCRACHRHYLEVAQWVTYTQEQKDAVWARIAPKLENTHDQTHRNPTAD